MDQTLKTSQEDHYFWLDKEFISLVKILSKRALLLYLLYVRSCNPKYGQCSMISYTSARNNIGLSHLAFDSAKDELIKYGFVKPRPDRKAGFYKTVPMEVLGLPKIENNTLTPSSLPRSISKTQGVFFLPSVLVDEARLKGLPLFELKTLLFLYSICSFQEYLGVDFHYIHAWDKAHANGIIKTNKKFGNQFHSSIKGKDCYKVAKAKDWQVDKSVLDALGGGIYSAINSLCEKHLLSLVPIVVWRDPEEAGISEVRKEIFSGIIKLDGDGEDAEDEFRLAPLEENEAAIWIFRPTWPAENMDYLKYLQIWEEERVEQLDIYNSDVGAIQS